jgi:hypothetical protein
LKDEVSNENNKYNEGILEDKRDNVGKWERAKMNLRLPVR